MELSQNLKLRRERLSLTQAWVAAALGVPRELLSYWETGARVPNARQVSRLAQVYRTTPKRLRDSTPETWNDDPLELFGDIDPADPVREALVDWISFLDRWEEFLRADLRRDLPGPGRPPPALAENALVHDRRRASALAASVRTHWQLGDYALPDLHAFMDQQQITVLRIPFGASEGVADRDPNRAMGAFYNHAELGFCVAIDSELSPSRQSFLLAHLLAHALFHYSEAAIVCRAGAGDRLERFADAFGACFEVPSKALRERVRERFERTGRSELQAPDAVEMANLFGVSLPSMMTRLESEGLISARTASAWRGIDGAELADRFGLTTPGSSGPTGDSDRPSVLARFPASVSAEIQRAVVEEVVSVDRAAEVLGVDPGELDRRWLAPRRSPDSGPRHDAGELAGVGA